MYKSSLVTALALLLTVGAAPALADQTPSPGQRPPEQTQPEQREEAQAAPIRGQLVSVNTDTKSLTVKPENGAEVTFQYDDSTEITGAKDGAAGLATMTDRDVTVHFREDATSKMKVATRIIVQPQQ